MEEKVLAGEVVKLIVGGKSATNGFPMDTSTPSKHSANVQPIAHLVQAEPGPKVVVASNTFKISDESNKSDSE